MVNAVDYTTVNRTVHLSNIIRAQYSTGRISLPQNGGLFARFKHVQGVPAQSADAGYSVSKLQMIDLLVERLIRLKGHAGAESSTLAAAAQNAESNPDALINHYATEVARALRVENGLSSSVTAGLVEPGMLFSLVA